MNLRPELNGALFVIAMVPNFFLVINRLSQLQKSGSGARTKAPKPNEVVRRSQINTNKKSHLRDAI